MAKLMIVDDDPWVCKYLSQGIAWQELDISRVSVAANGVKALALLREDRYDVVISDVKMDAMDGLELQQVIRAEFPWIRIILLSGYGDAGWVRQALKAGAVDYLFKPVDDQVLKALVASTLQDAQEEIRREQTRMKQDEQLKRSGTLFLRDALERTMRGQMTNASDFPPWLLQPAETYLIVIEPDEGIDPVVCQADIEKTFDRHGEYLSMNLDDRIYLVCRIGRDFLEKVLARLAYQVNVRMGVSDRFADWEGINAAITHASQACWQLFYHAEERVRFYRSNPDNQMVQPISMVEFSGALRDNMYEKACDCLKYLFERLDQMQPDKPIVQLFALRFYALMSETGSDAVATSFTAQDAIKGYQTLDDMRSGFTMLLKRALGGNERVNMRRLIVDAVELIDQKLGEDITLEKIAQALCIHPAYLSRLFKENTGMTFTHYLAQQRMRKARVLLGDATLRINEISRMVGYENVKYFNRVFRNIHNMSPGEYRETTTYRPKS